MKAYAKIIEELATKLNTPHDELVVGVLVGEEGVIIESLDDNISSDAIEVIVAVKEKYGLNMVIDATDGLTVRLW